MQHHQRQCRRCCISKAFLPAGFCGRYRQVPASHPHSSLSDKSTCAGYDGRTLPDRQSATSTGPVSQPRSPRQVTLDCRVNTDTHPGSPKRLISLDKHLLRDILVRYDPAAGVTPCVSDPRVTRRKRTSSTPISCRSQERIAPRSSTCISSRTFPGQLYSPSFANAAPRSCACVASPDPSAPESAPPAAEDPPSARAAQEPPLEIPRGGGRGPGERSSPPLVCSSG